MQPGLLFFSAYIVTLKQRRVQGFSPALSCFDRIFFKHGINLSAGGYKITAIEVNLGNLDICIAGRILI